MTATSSRRSECPLSGARNSPRTCPSWSTTAAPFPCQSMFMLCRCTLWRLAREKSPHAMLCLPGLTRVPGGQFAMGEEPHPAGCRFRQPRSVAMSETRLTKLATCLLLLYSRIARLHASPAFAHPNAPSMSISRSDHSVVDEERSPWDARGISCATTCPQAGCPASKRNPTLVVCAGWTRASSMASRGTTRGHRQGRPC
jgi:hypothetical protein